MLVRFFLLQVGTAFQTSHELDLRGLPDRDTISAALRSLPSFTDLVDVIATQYIDNEQTGARFHFITV